MRLLRHRRLAVQAAAILGLASTAAAHAAGLQPLSAKVVAHWTAVAACETGGGGPPKWDWGSKHRPGEGTLFEGGVGFSAYMWKVWAGELPLPVVPGTPLPDPRCGVPVPSYVRDYGLARD